MPRPLVLRSRLSAVPLVSRTSRGAFRRPVRACLRPVAEGVETEGLALCRGIAEAEASGSAASAAAEPLRRRRCSRSRSRGRRGQGEPQPQPQPALGAAAAAAQTARHGDQYQRKREPAADLSKKERRGHPIAVEAGALAERANPGHRAARTRVAQEEAGDACQYLAYQVLKYVSLLRKYHCDETLCQTS